MEGITKKKPLKLCPKCSDGDRVRILVRAEKCPLCGEVLEDNEK